TGEIPWILADVVDHLGPPGGRGSPAHTGADRDTDVLRRRRAFPRSEHQITPLDPVDAHPVVVRESVVEQYHDFRRRLARLSIDNASYLVEGFEVHITPTPPDRSAPQTFFSPLP